MVRKIVFLFIFTELLISSNVVQSQDSTFGWFPKSNLFPLLTYDLLETQPYAGIFFLNAASVSYKGAYIPVNIGFRKAFCQGKVNETTYEFVLAAASYTQFEIIRYEANTLRGGLLNTDFKASGFFNLKKDKHAFRVQLFHVSSHLGDDYMLRNEAFELNNKTINYEQVDIIYMYRAESTDIYIGPGFVITPNAFRDRWMVELGFQGMSMLNSTWGINYGADIKVYQQNNYIPDGHAGVGISLFVKDKKQIDLGLDVFYGHLPYSTLDFGEISWLGLSTHIYL